jgi:peptidoglycan biosynthesis protein MviN/MurJ (putative lipid II flippase)
MIKSSTLVSGFYAVGMLLGFLRDMILVRVVGTGETTDAFLVAVFLSDALRTTVAAGVLAAAFLPLWVASPAEERGRIAASATLGLLGTTIAIAIALQLAAPVLISVLGPGLAPSGRATALACFDVLVWAIPALSVYGLLGAIQNGGHRFMLPAAGSVIYNGGAIVYLGVMRHDSSVTGLSHANLLATIVMAAILMPGAWRCGWRPFSRATAWRDFSMLAGRLLPLLASAFAGHAAVVIERALASLLGEGMVTLVNLARKFVSLPIAAVNSFSQVALPALVRAHFRQGGDALRRQLWLSLGVGTLLTWPASMTFALWAPSLSAFLLASSGDEQRQMLAWLIGAFALSVVPASWNILLARGYYAQDDMVTPTKIELVGMGVHLCGLALLYRLFGVWAVPAAVFAGAFVTTVLLARWSPLRADLAGGTKAVAALAAASALIYLVTALLAPTGATWTQLGLAVVFLGGLTGAGVAALWLLGGRHDFRSLTVLERAVEPP